MQNPGVYNLGDRAITTALTGEVITDGTSAAGEDQAFIDRLDGMTAATISARFSYGSGGTSCKVWVQTSLDQGVTWVDIACFAFTTSSAHKMTNLSAALETANQLTPTDGALADNTNVDSILGDRLRVKITTTGTYAGSTTLAVRAAVR